MNLSPVDRLEPMGRCAREAAGQLAVLGTRVKNDVLEAIASSIEHDASMILAANAADIDDARAAGLGDAMVDRLLLDGERLAGLSADTRKIIQLPDPVGTDISSRRLQNGLRLTKRRVPIGVLGVIYEARPNVTIDIATLCLKTGNAVILRGGRETLRSNLALTKAIRSALKTIGVPQDAVQYIDNPDRSLVTRLLQLDEYVDMIVPRGGARLHELCRKQSTIPVITGGIGICHIFVDESADLERAVDIIENAKVQRPSVCNALDTLLVHRSVAPTVLPAVVERLSKSGVQFRAAPEVMSLLEKVDHGGSVREAGPDDFDQEWLSLVLGIRIVPDLDEAIEHIRLHSTEHSDSILTNDHSHAERFVAEVDSAAVYVNASTRFTDGGQFGLGAEVAVSTQKLHARGPMGLEELTTYKWIVFGDGHVRP
jgi:glutamate-5-semialdehyde dehydrogenase